MNATTHDLPNSWLPMAPAAEAALAVKAGAAQSAVSLELQSGSGDWRAAWQRWLDAAANLARGHGLQPDRAGRYVAHFRMSEALRGRWHDLFAHSARRSDDAPCAFLYSQPAVTQVHARLFADLGLNARHLVHLRHQVWHPLGVPAYGSAQDQRLECRLKRLVRIGPAAVMLVVEIEVFDGAGGVVALIEDSFVARHLDSADVMLADDDPVLRRAIARLRRRACEIDAGVDRARCTRLEIGGGERQAFDRMAGDINPLPGCGWAAQLLGCQRAALQGTHLRNLVARELSRWGLAVARLSITFVGRAQADQPLQLVHFDDRFELCDESGRLLAFGRC